MPPARLEISDLGRPHARSLVALFEALQKAQEDAQFSPHPLTQAHIDALCERSRADLYYVAHAGDAVLGYGLLRGWDEGYATPSLGIAVHPAHRGRGLAPALMSFLHAAAALHGATQVRLRVHPGNARAIGLYRREGYAFDDRPDASGLLVAYRSLAR